MRDLKCSPTRAEEINRNYQMKYLKTYMFTQSLASKTFIEGYRKSWVKLLLPKLRVNLSR